MNLAVIRERGPFDRRVALTPPVVRCLCAAGHAALLAPQGVDTPVESCSWLKRGEYTLRGRNG